MEAAAGAQGCSRRARRREAGGAVRGIRKRPACDKRPLTPSSTPSSSPPQFFDENLDGFISLSELQAVYRQAAAESGGAVEIPKDDILRQMIAEADSDGDGKLSEDEFYALIEACA